MVGLIGSVLMWSESMSSKPCGRGIGLFSIIFVFITKSIDEVIGRGELISGGDAGERGVMYSTFDGVAATVQSNKLVRVSKTYMQQKTRCDWPACLRVFSVSDRVSH